MVTVDTEVLTPSGWKKVTEIDMYTYVVQWNTDHTTNWTKLIKLIPAVAKRIFFFHSDHVNQAVSEHHKIMDLTKKRKLRIIKAKDIKPTIHYHFINTGPIREPIGSDLASLTAEWCQNHLTGLGNWDKDECLYTGEDKDRVQGIGTLAGWRTLLRDDMLYIWRNLYISTGGEVKKVELPGESAIHVEVPSNFLLVRRAGCVSVLGKNSS